MTMVAYANIRNNGREFLALTGLTLREFQLLLGGFTRAYERLYPAGRTVEGRPRRRASGGGGKGVLGGPEQRLLFILTYLKTYPLQVVMGELFGLSQPGVNHWVHRLLPVVLGALDEVGARPERVPGDFARSQADPGAAGPLIIDGTDRRRQRPKNPLEQAVHYSGKKKAHTDKNLVIAAAPEGRGERVEFLGRTYPGSAHDKKIADHEAISYPSGAALYKDTGFQGYEPAVAKTYQPKKSRAGGNSRPRRSGRTGSCRASGSGWSTLSQASNAPAS